MLKQQQTEQQLLIMYSVKSSSSRGRRREEEEGDSEMCTGVRREHPDRERLNVTPKKEKQTPRGKKRGKNDRKIQFVSHKRPIRDIRAANGRESFEQFQLKTSGQMG
ncbi:hypothetical protein NQD34_001025 [Periophthalmus magnuspinnatus]|nr:hypothetical protein NQD34_001025 [Periophthalmus magnuspinnatus]